MQHPERSLSPGNRRSQHGAQTMRPLIAGATATARVGLHYTHREPSVDAVLRHELREHVAASLYPEEVEYLDVIEKAIVLCVCGFPKAELRLIETIVEAGVIVAALDLEPFVHARTRSRLN